ncbi:hypothetical protein BJX62DRAFT_248768 [Aspergillus germanicus]
MTKPKRKYTSRARTGCETCRIRRVKCDESPGSCRNCTSTGRKCEGYDMTRLPRRRSPLGVGVGGAVMMTMTMVNDLGAAALPGKTSDERRCFDVFQNRTIPMFMTLFDSDVWRVVLQMSQSDPSVCHAVVAFSALHEGTLRQQRHWAQGRSLDIRHRDFALKQYGRALSSLAFRLRSNDPQMRYVTLVCCIVFVLFELLNDNYSGVLVHLQNGVNVLTNTTGEPARASIIGGAIHPSGSNSPRFDAALRRTFAHLDVQSIYFDRASRAMNIYPSYGDPVNLDDCPVWFDSLYGAKETIDPLLNNVLAIWRVSQMILRDNDARAGPAYENLLAEQHRMRTYLARHVAAFTQFLTRHPPTTARDLRSRDVILLDHIVLFMNVEACIGLSEMVFDAWHAEWTETVNLIEKIIRSAIAEFGSISALPNVVFDLGINLPLGWVVLKCRDPVLRQRALDLQRLWPHSEGLHPTAFLMNMGQQVSNIEQEGMNPVTGVIPEEARIRTVNIEIDEDRTRGKLIYSLSDPTAEQLVVRERWSSSLRPRRKRPSEMSTSLSSTPAY